MPILAETGISVVMPVHNGGAYLQVAVDSILSQTHSKLELIIVDDHSNDRAIAALKVDSRVKCFKSSHRGIVAALNLGISKAQHSYIARMDGDDIAHPERLAVQLQFLIDNPKVDIAGAKVELFSDAGKTGDGYQLYQEWINTQCTQRQISHNFFVESCIPHPTAMLHRRIFEALGGYADTPWPEDYDLWCRAYLTGYKFGKPDTKPLLKWRDHPSRTSRQQERYSKQEFLRCKAYFLSQWLTQRGHNECVIWGTGPTGLKLHDYLEQNTISVRGFVDINPKLENASKREKPVHIISTQPTKAELSALSPIGVIAVSARGARERIHAACCEAGLIELDDFIFAA